MRANNLLRNCAFYTQAHRAMLSPDSVKVTVPPSILEAPGMDLLAYLLLPLAGPEEYDLEVSMSISHRYSMLRITSGVGARASTPIFAISSRDQKARTRPRYPIDTR